MKTNSFRLLSAAFVLAILQACSTAPVIQNQGIPGTATPVPFVAETGGPTGFSATLSAPDIVLLSWEPVAEATGYRVQIVFDGLDPLTIAYLPAEATSFEHILAPESSLLTYRLQTMTASGPGGASSLQIATQNHAANPLTVQAAFAESGMVSAVIGPAGGTLETTDTRGVSYSLEIPPAALNGDIEIKMTPVSSIDGWPLDGNFLGAVRLEPEGWLLNEVATLTISLPGARNPALSTVGIAFSGSGEEFHLTQTYADAALTASLGTGNARRGDPVQPQEVNVIRLPVMELRTDGVGEASADAGATMATENAPTDRSDAADQKSAATEAAMDELTPLLSNLELGELATSNLVTQIRSAKDCADFKQAVGGFHAWEGKVAQLGDNYSADRQVIMQEMAEKAVETIERAGEECVAAQPGVVPVSVPCAEKLTRDIQSAGTVAGSDPFFTDLQHAITSDQGLKDRLTAADNASEQCAHSFGVNEAASLGYHWTSACIPSLNRPYQVAWIGPTLEGIYRLYPNANDPFSGRVEGRAVSAMAGTSLTIVYDGTYRIDVLQETPGGDPVNMDAFLTYGMTITACAGGFCNTTEENGEHQIPLQIRNERCPVP
jgi:hypothetical protein